MDFNIYSYKDALVRISESEMMKKHCDELFETIKSISETDLMDYFYVYSGRSKSLSKVIKKLLDDKLQENNWEKNINMYCGDSYVDQKRFAFDYYKSGLTLEVAFNHESACAWKLIKGNLNSTKMDVNVTSKISILITVDSRMRFLGGFDGAIGTFEKYQTYLEPLQDILEKPILLIGLNPLKDFHIKHRQYLNKKIGIVKETD